MLREENIGIKESLFSLHLVCLCILQHFEANKDNLNLVLKHGGHLVLSQNDTIMVSA